MRGLWVHVLETIITRQTGGYDSYSRRKQYAQPYGFDRCCDGHVLRAGWRDASCTHLQLEQHQIQDRRRRTACFSTKAEIRKVYRQVPFTPEKWRRQARENTLPKLPQGIIVGCQNKGGETDDADVHCMMVGTAGCRWLRQDGLLAVP